MFNLNLKSPMILIACLCLFMAASCVSASEINDMNNLTSIGNADSNDILEVCENQVDEEILAENDIGNFEDFNRKIPLLTDCFNLEAKKAPAHRADWGLTR